MDGYLKIKTKIDNSGIDKDIKQLEDKIKKLQEDNLKQSDSQRDLQAEIDKYEQLTQKSDEYHQKIKELKAEQKGMFSENGTLPSNLFEKYQAISEQIKQTELEESKLNAEIDKQAPKVEKVYTKLEQVKRKQTENNAKITEFKQKIEQINTNNIKNNIDSIGQKLTGQISKLGKMALAVTGIRTAWMGVRRIISMVSSYDSQISTDLEYMGYAIANIFAPAVQGLIKLLYTVLSYVNAIMSAWFGINLFSRSSADSFKKMKASAGSTAKSAKEIQKSLQGFDEMNILSDGSSSSGGTGVGGITTPSFDLSSMQAEVPKWLQWIIDNKEIILAVLAGIAAGIAAIKLSELLSGLGLLKAGLTGIKALGIGLLVTGIILLIQDLIKFIKDPSWANFGKVLVDIGIILAGIALLTGNWIVAIVALVAIIAGLCIQLFSQKTAIMSVEDAQKNLEKATKDLEEANDNYINSVDKAENALKTLEDAEKRTGLSGEELNKQVEQGILDYQDMTDEQKEVYKAYINNEKAQKELKDATTALTEAKKKEKIASWENKLAVMAETGEYDDYKKAVVEAFKNGELSADEARDLIGKSMSGMSRDSQQTFMEDLPSDIKDGLDPKKYESAGQRISKWFENLGTKIKEKFSDIGSAISNAIGNAFRAVINAVIRDVENKINNFIRAINGAIGIINAIPGVNIPKMSLLSLPRLAKGGIITQPTQAIIGEAGKEAVIPLENNLEYLDLMADKIASKISSNGGTYIINMDGRTVQRGIAKRQQELAFMTNGR